MAKDKTELDSLARDVLTLISIELDKANEPQILQSRRTCFPIFRKDVFQKKRILTQLARYAYQGNVARVAGLFKIRPDLRLEVLFTLAGLGAQDEMETILKQYPEDLLEYRPLRDISGALFERITLLQHCLWTKDVLYMANMMFDCLPKNKRGENIRQDLVRQYEEHMANGVTYRLNGVKHENERHFNLQPLIRSFRTHVEMSSRWTPEQLDTYWRDIIGKGQALIPAHIRHHFCDPEQGFWGDVNLKKAKLKRKLSIHSYKLNKIQLWCEGLVGLGKDFGIYAGRCNIVAAQERGEPSEDNLKALMALDTTRTESDLPLLIKRLHNPILNLDHDLDLQSMKY